MEKWLLPPADYARVHEARSESEALLVQRILHDAGIPAILRSRQDDWRLHLRLLPHPILLSRQGGWQLCPQVTD